MSRRIKILQAFFGNIKSSVAFILLCVFTISLLTNIFFILLTDYKENFVRTHDELNAEHISFILENGNIEALEHGIDEEMSGNSEITVYEKNRVYHSWLSCDYIGEKMESHFCFLSEEEALNKNIGRFEILSRDDGKEGVVVPYVFQVNGYSVGDTFTLSNGVSELSLPIVGFYSNAMSATLNCGYISILFTQNAENEIKSFLGAEKVMCGVRLKTPSENTKVELKYANEIAKAVPGTAVTISNKYNSVFDGRFVIETISMAIICGLVVLMILLTMFIISSGIASLISDNKAMVGILSSVGYTSHDIIISVIPAVLILILLTLIAGVGISYPLFPYINRILETQTGLPYRLTFQPVPAVLTVLIPLCCISLTVFFSLLKLKNITPLDAISERRQRARSQSRVTVKNLRLPLKLALPVQNMLTNAGKSILVLVTALLVAFLCAFGTSLLQNIVINDTEVAGFILGEFADSSVVVHNEGCDSVCEYLDSQAEAENYVGYYTIPAQGENGDYLSAIVVDDTSRLTNKSYCYEGHLPAKKGEATIGGKYARDAGISVGDRMKLCFSGTEIELTVCGLTQSGKYLGYDTMITRETYESIMPGQAYQYYIYLNAETDVPQFNKTLSQNCQTMFLSDMRSSLNALESTYFTGIKIVCRVMITISVFMVLLVLYILMKNLIDHKKNDFAIMMGLGYTSHSIMFITAVTYLPAIILGVFLGTGLSFFTFNPIMSLLLRSIGIERCNFDISIGLLSVAAVSIVVVSVVFMLLFFGQIKKTNIKEQILS